MVNDEWLMVNGESASHGERSYASVKAALQRLKQLRCGIPSGWSLVSRKGRKEREDSSADEWRTPTTHLLLRSNEPMKFAKAPRAYALRLTPSVPTSRPSSNLRSKRT